MSYSRTDIDKAKRLVAKLETRFDVWFDKDDIAGGENWLRAIQDGLESADVVVFLVSPASVASNWVQKEITRALELNIRVIPYVVEAVTENFLMQTSQPIDATGRDAFQRLIDAISDIQPDSLATNSTQAKLTSSGKWAEWKTPASIIGIVGLVLMCGAIYMPLCSSAAYFWCPPTPTPVQIVSPTEFSEIITSNTEPSEIGTNSPIVTSSNTPNNSAIPTNPPEPSPEDSPSLVTEHPNPDIRIYAIVSYFAVHLLTADVASVDMRELSFRSQVDGRTVERELLAFISDFQATEGRGTQGRCYILRLEAGAVPSPCQANPDPRIVSSSDRFWFSQVTESLVAVNVYYDGELIVSCSPLDLEGGCDIYIP